MSRENREGGAEPSDEDEVSALVNNVLQNKPVPNTLLVIRQNVVVASKSHWGTTKLGSIPTKFVQVENRTKWMKSDR